MSRAKQPHTTHTHSLNPMTTLTQVQKDQAFDALTDEELESVVGGNRRCIRGLHPWAWKASTERHIANDLERALIDGGGGAAPERLNTPSRQQSRGF